MLWLFVMFPQSTLPEPSDSIFVIRSIMRSVDASFRRGCGSVIIQGGRRVYELSRAQEKRGELACFFVNVVQSFPC